MSSPDTLQVFETKSCHTLVIGGGIAGSWTALKLIEQGVPTVLMTYDLSDRGGQLGASVLSVGAINTSALYRDDFGQWLEEIGRSQTHPSVAPTIQSYLCTELASLQELDKLKPIELGTALACGSGKVLLKHLRSLLIEKGVEIISDGWVTRFDIEGNTCNGIQYQVGSAIGAISTATIVIASGGYASLFHGAVKSGTYGALQARFLMAGGRLSNTEFIFKHGYGQPDLGKLTPTEELPGAQITDDDGQSVTWLEEELFYGRGTHNHFQAFMTWRKDEKKRYYVDFTFCALHQLIKTLLRLDADLDTATKQLNALAPAIDAAALRTLFHALFTQKSEYTFKFFNECKPIFAPHLSASKFYIRQISYFSMGGIWHREFQTNIENVWVNGEAMHDFGAHRTGGLPWALYLSAAKKISLDIRKRMDSGFQWHPVSLISELSIFDGSRLKELQLKLLHHQESGRGRAALIELNQWLANEKLSHSGSHLDDYFAYLTIAQAIVTASLVREESRGCFFRQDYSQEDSLLTQKNSVSYYEPRSHTVSSRMQQASSTSSQFLQNQENANAVFALLLKHLDTPRATQPAYIYENTEISYLELNERVQQIAFGIGKLGIVPGDRVAIFMYDSPDWVALFLACLQSGIVAVALNTFIKQNELPNYLNDCGARALFADGELLENVATFVATQSPTCILINLQSTALFASERMTEVAVVEPNSPAFILYSSGSTGKPKAVLHQHSSLAFTAENFAKDFLSSSENDVFLSSSRLFFAYGLGNSLTFPLYTGATCVLTPRSPQPAEILELIYRRNISVFFAIPAIYSQLLALQNAKNTLAKCKARLRLCVSAGEPLPPNLASRWVDISQIKLIDGLGSTEALHIFLCNVYEPKMDAITGQSVKGYRVVLLDDHNFAIEKQGVTGKLAVKGGSLALGYFNNTEAFMASRVGDLLLTGDQYQRNSQNQLLYIGRKGDMFKSNGLWVSSYDISNHIRQLPYVKEAAHVVFTIDQQQYTAAFVTWDLAALILENIIPSENLDEYTEQNLINNWLWKPIRRSLSAFKIPNAIHTISTVPRTAIGKVDKPALIELAKQAVIRDKDLSSAPRHGPITSESI